MTFESRAGEAREPAQRYKDGRYLRSNRTWHEEDSPYKADFVKAAIDKNSIEFRSCADVGCGAGLVTAILAAEFPDKSFTGYDVSSDARMFWDRRNSVPNIRFLQENILTGDEYYDLVLCLDVFEHIDDYFGFLRALRAKGRQFIFNIPLDMNVLRIVSPGIKHAREHYGHLHYFNEYSAVETLKDTGYEIKDKFLSGIFTRVPPRNLLQALVAVPRLVLNAVGKSFAATMLGGYSLVVVCGNGR